MADMTNPYTALVSYQAAYREGRIRPERCALHPNMVGLRDEETGKVRYSYALVEEGMVKGLALFIAGLPEAHIPLFNVGYAVDERYRGQGIAARVMEAGIAEMRAATKKPFQSFYVKAVIGMSNLASQKVAERIFTSVPRDIVDGVSGQPALLYLRLIECA